MENPNPTPTLEEAIANVLAKYREQTGSDTPDAVIILACKATPVEDNPGHYQNATVGVTMGVNHALSALVDNLEEQVIPDLRKGMLLHRIGLPMDLASKLPPELQKLLELSATKAGRRSVVEAVKGGLDGVMNAFKEAGIHDCKACDHSDCDHRTEPFEGQEQHEPEEIEPQGEVLSHEVLSLETIQAMLSNHFGRVEVVKVKRGTLLPGMPGYMEN
jgi:hypothetical protein